MLAATGLALGVAAPAALAQTGYPGNPTTTTPQPTSAFLDLGLKPLGAVFDVTQCNFKPGAMITIVVNDRPIASVAADNDGCIILHIEILPNLTSVSQSMARHPYAAAGLAADRNQRTDQGQRTTAHDRPDRLGRQHPSPPAREPTTRAARSR